MTSWKKTITSPFRKACTFFNPQSPRGSKKPQTGHDQNRIMDLHGEVMACGYEDVQVMWSILDKQPAILLQIETNPHLVHPKVSTSSSKENKKDKRVPNCSIACNGVC